MPESPRKSGRAIHRGDGAGASPPTRVPLPPRWLSRQRQECVNAHGFALRPLPCRFRSLDPPQGGRAMPGPVQAGGTTGVRRMPWDDLVELGIRADCLFSAHSASENAGRADLGIPNHSGKLRQSATERPRGPSRHTRAYGRTQRSLPHQECTRRPEAMGRQLWRVRNTPAGAACPRN